MSSSKPEKEQPFRYYRFQMKKENDPAEKENDLFFRKMYDLIVAQRKLTFVSLDSGYRKSRGLMHITQIPQDIFRQIPQSTYNNINDYSNKIEIVSLIGFGKQIQFTCLFNLNILIWEIIDQQTQLPVEPCSSEASDQNGSLLWDDPFDLPPPQLPRFSIPTRTRV
jgi:hypothetical protein